MNRKQAEFNYRKLRAPAKHGAALIDPPLSEISSLLDQGQHRLKNASASIGGMPLPNFRDLTKSELNHLFDDALDASKPIVASGHQPELFHPGVWLKNWLLHEIARRFNAQPVNFVIDNDLADSVSLKSPAFKDGKIEFESVTFDRPTAALPWEERPIADFQFFASFGERLTQRLENIAPDAIIRQLWPLVVEAANKTKKIGAAIARGRQRLEESLGVTNHEAPLSRMCQTKSFAKFAAAVLFDIERFQSIYNTALSEYRCVHKLRSETHPAPDLIRRQRSFETPFWVWSTERPARRPMFIEQTSNGVILTNHHGVEWPVGFNDAETISSDIFRAARHGVKIRPRALMTTMFLRLAVCDLFIHGIGGAMYDQATDLIARRFFGVTPAPFITATATLKLPWHSEPVDQHSAIAAHKRMLRDLTFNPQRFLKGSESEQSSALLAERQRWIDQSPPPGEGKHRRREIMRINHQLQPFVQNQREQTKAQLLELQNQQRFFQQATSREFSFALFPAALLVNEYEKMLRES